MSFITAAREFMEDPGELSEDPNLDIMYDTVGYLLENAIGLENAKSTNNIIRFLNDSGHKINGKAINRKQWEIIILGKIRDEGVFVASHRKGMYIIKDRKEADAFYIQYAKRIKVDARLQFLSILIEFGHWDD